MQNEDFMTPLSGQNELGGPSEKLVKLPKSPTRGSRSFTIAERKSLELAQLSPERLAHLYMKGHRDLIRWKIRESKDPALMSLQVGLALEILMDRPLTGYYELRKLLGNE